MNTNIVHPTGQASAQGSATILQFPVGGRAGLSVPRAETTGERTLQNANVMYGSSWYHAAAIEQSVVPKA
jgi:hypothetical protein